METSTVRRQLYWRLAIGLLAAAGAYGWYVTVRYGRLNDLNQRQLTNAAAELKNNIENAVETVSRFDPPANYKKALCKFDEDQPYLSLVSPARCDVSTGKLVKVKPTATAPLGIVALATASRDTIQFEFQTGALLRELSFPESFGLIFIAKADGSVLYQDSPSKRTWLRQLRWGEQQFRDSGANRYGSLKLVQLVNIFGDDKASGWPRLQSMSGRTTLALGGEFHEVYLEPLVLENREERISLVLGGAVPTEALVRQALAVDTYFLAGIVFFLLVAGLGYPFVKLLALDAHEAFRLRDVIELYLSTAALLALLTFTIQALDAYSRWHRVADAGLAQLAVAFERAFLEEVASIQRQADDNDKIVSGWSNEQLSSPPATDWYRREHPKLPVPEGALLINQMSWIDPQGFQIWKIASDQITAKQKLSQRVYFQSVRDKYLYQCGDPSKCGAAGPFYVGPERSITDGRFYTFVALPSRLRNRGGYVVSTTARLFSLNTPALPAGYGFAVINREGRVLYHSDRRLSMRENLFDELNAGAHARALVYAGREDDVTSAYRERPHQLHFHPIALRLAADDTPAGFYVVTFRDISIERALVARVFLISLVGPMLLLLFFIGVSLLAIATVPVGRREHWSAWLWPHGGLVQVYREISIVLSVLLAATLGAWAAGATDAVFIAVPLLAASSTVAIYAHRTRQQPMRRHLHSKSWHSTMFVLLLVCTIVVPASALFRAAMGHEFGKLVATEQEWMAALRTDLTTALEAELRAEDRPDWLIQRMAKTRAESLARVSAPAPFDALASEMVMAPATHMLLTPFHWADSLLPIENDYAARERYEEREYTYTPGAPWLSKLGISAWGIMALASTLALLAWWIRWKAVRLFFADMETSPQENVAPDLLWARCTADERLILIRIARDHVANPYQQRVVEGLLNRGLLTLDPDLRPSSRAFAEFIAQREPELQAELERWENVDSGHSWRYARVVLLTSLAGLGFFIVATQPGLQAGLLGITGGITGTLTALLKLRDSVVSWMSNRGAGVPS